MPKETKTNDPVAWPGRSLYLEGWARDELARYSTLRRIGVPGTLLEALVLRDLIDEFATVAAQAGDDVVDVVDGEPDAAYAQRIRRCRSGTSRATARRSRCSSSIGETCLATADVPCV